MAPFILEKRLEKTEDGYLVRFTQEEVQAMELNPEERVLVQLTAPHAGWDRIGDTTASPKEHTYEAAWD